MVAPNFGGDDNANNKNSDHKSKPFINFNHPIFGWIQVPVKSWSFATLKITNDDVGDVKVNGPNSLDVESVTSPKTSTTKPVVSHRRDYLKKLYTRIDRQREEATVNLANHKPSRERIVHDAIVTNEHGVRVIEAVELFIVHGRAGRVTFARPLAYLRPPFMIEDKSIRSDLARLNLDGVYIATDPASEEVVELAIDEAASGVRFAIYERDVSGELKLEATLRLEEGGYALPDRGEFDGGHDSWKCASERFWALLERIYWDCLAVVGGSECN